MALLKNKKFDFNLFFKNALKVLLLVFISVSMILSFVNTIKSYKEDKTSTHEILTLHRFDKGLTFANTVTGTAVPNTGYVDTIYFNTDYTTMNDLMNYMFSNGVQMSDFTLSGSTLVNIFYFDTNESAIFFSVGIDVSTQTPTSFEIMYFDNSTGGDTDIKSICKADSSSNFNIIWSISTLTPRSTALSSGNILGEQYNVGTINSKINNFMSITPFTEPTYYIDISNQTWLFAKDSFINNVDLVKPFLAVSNDDRDLFRDKVKFSFNNTYTLGNLSSSSTWGQDLMGFSSDTGFTIFYDNKELELYNSATNKVIDSMYNYYITFAPNTYVWYGAYDDMPNNSEDSYYIAFLDIQEDFEPSLEIYEYLTSNIFRVYNSFTTQVEASTRTYNYNDSEVPNFIFDFTFGSNGQTFFGVNRFNNNLSYKLIDGSYLQVMANNVWIDYAYQVITYDTQSASFYTEDALYKTFGLLGNQRQYRVSGWYTFNLVPDVSSIFDSSGFWYYEKPFLSNNTSYSGFSIEYYSDSLITRIRYLNSASGVYELVYDSNGWVSDNYRYLFLGNVIVSSNTYFDLLSTGLYGYISTNSFDTTLPDLFFTIADVPIYTLSQLLSFELFGTQLFVAFSSIITLILVVFVIRKLI